MVKCAHFYFRCVVWLHTLGTFGYIFLPYKTVGHVLLVAIAGTSFLMKADTGKFHVRVPDLQTSCRDLTIWQLYPDSRPTTLHWRHNGRDRVSNHRHPDYLLHLLFRCRSKKTSKLRVTGLCEGNSPETGEFPSQRASNAENVSIWWRHHGAYIQDLGNQKDHVMWFVSGMKGMTLKWQSCDRTILQTIFDPIKRII